MKQGATSQGSSMLASTHSNSSFTFNKHAGPNTGVVNRFEQNTSQFFTVSNNQDGAEAEMLIRLNKTTY